MKRHILWILLILLVSPGGTSVFAQYTQPKQVVDAGGQTGQNAAYTQTGSVGQSSPIGASSNTLYLNYGGFWGGGRGAAPVVYTLTVHLSETCAGKVIGAGIDCGPDSADCSETYATGTLVILMAQEDACSRFVEWQDDQRNPLAPPLTVMQDLTVVAVFDADCPAPFALLSPGNGTTNQPVETDLDWEDAAGADSYQVYFGTSSPPPLFATVTTSAYDPGPLATDSTYYWQITATNTCGATKSAEWSFQTLRTFMSVGFHEGVNVGEGTTERDATVMSLSPGIMQTVTDILLPNVPVLFSFSEAVAFYFEYHNAAIVFTPTSAVTLMTIVDSSTGGESYPDIHADDLSRLTFSLPAKAAVTATMTVVFERTDGRYFKIGNIAANPGQWTVRFDVEELLP